MDFNNEEMSLWNDLFEGSNQKLQVIVDGELKLINTENYFGRHVIGKILVLPRSSAQLFEYNKKWACISISDADSRPAKVKCDNMIQLHFDDIEMPRVGRETITEEQAEQILQFANNVWNDVDLLMIHCNAGISRSPAIAKVLSLIHQPEYAEFYDQLYSPNKLVVAKMREKSNV